MFKKILLVFLCLVMMLSLCACKSKIDNDLLGTWEYSKDTHTKYEFNEDGTGCLCVQIKKNDEVVEEHYEYTYNCNGDKLQIDFKANILTDCVYTYSISGKNLTFIGGEGTDGGTYLLNKIK